MVKARGRREGSIATPVRRSRTQSRIVTPLNMPGPQCFRSISRQFIQTPPHGAPMPGVRQIICRLLFQIQIQRLCATDTATAAERVLEEIVEIAGAAGVSAPDEHL